MPRVVLLKDIWAMLDACAPGHTRRATDHNWRVTFNGRIYATLPLGPHGRRENPEIETGHVRAMVRHLQIRGCAERHLNLA